MNYLKIKLDEITKDKIELIANYFKAGKVIAYPTETIYGLGCIASDKKAINRIYNIKKRDKNKPMLVLVKSYCMLKKYCFVSAKQDKFLRTFWIKKDQNLQKDILPTSVILKSRGLLPKELLGSDNSIAVRMPTQSEFLIQILKRVDTPIVSTSLNISGQKVLSKIGDLEEYFGKNEIDLVIDAGKIANKKSSRLIDIRDMDDIKVIRE